MTPEENERARKVIEEAWGPQVRDHEEQWWDDGLLTAIADAIRAAQAEARAETWEEAATYVNSGRTYEVFRLKAAALRQAATKEPTR